jgi:hypothetical protein
MDDLEEAEHKGLQQKKRADDYSPKHYQGRGKTLDDRGS